jgi:hypothetical protein
MKRFYTIAVFAVVAATLAACAAGSPDAHRAAGGGPIAELVLGFWHGLIAPITLIVEIIHRYVPHVLPWSWRMYETGAGVPYDIGFYLGLAGGPSFLFSRR